MTHSGQTEPSDPVTASDRKSAHCGLSPTAAAKHEPPEPPLAQRLGLYPSYVDAGAETKAIRLPRGRAEGEATLPSPAGPAVCRHAFGNIVANLEKRAKDLRRSGDSSALSAAGVAVDQRPGDARCGSGSLHSPAFAMRMSRTARRSPRHCRLISARPPFGQGGPSSSRHSGVSAFIFA
jgi:hypothetical protein